MSLPHPVLHLKLADPFHSAGFIDHVVDGGWLHGVPDGGMIIDVSLASFRFHLPRLLWLFNNHHIFSELLLELSLGLQVRINGTSC